MRMRSPIAVGLAALLCGCPIISQDLANQKTQIPGDTATDEDDADGDGFTVEEGDCDDTDPNISPTSTDNVGDRIDQNCDEIDGYDGDGDRYASEASGGDDCDDTDAQLTPEDVDGDGFSTCDGDCDDTDATRSPADTDGDSFSVCDGDCNEGDSSIFPYDRDGDGVTEGCGWSVSAGRHHACALSSAGEVTCWGRNEQGQLGTGESQAYAQISGGGQHSCGLDAAGVVSCWGLNDGSTQDQGQVTGTPSGTFARVSAGAWHTCALTDTGAVSCWGRDDLDQVSVVPSGAYAQVSSGYFHNCALDAAGTMACWGANDEGQRTVPDGTFIDVSAGGNHTCAIRTSGAISCWGRDDDGEVSRAPSGVFTSVSAGYFHNCAVAATGSISCWGNNESGESSPPTGTYTQVSVGDLHSCAVDTSGLISCWGDDYYGQVSNAPGAPGPPDTGTDTGGSDTGDAGDTGDTGSGCGEQVISYGFNDTLMDGWTVASSEGLTWQMASYVDPQTSDARYTSAPGALYFGNPSSSPPTYGTGQPVSASVVSPAITLPVSGETRVGFQAYLDIEDSQYYDTLTLDVGLNGTQSTVWSKEQVSTIPTSGFVEADADLSSWNGMTIQLLFTFDSVDYNSNSGEGVYIDDLVVDSDCQSTPP